MADNLDARMRPLSAHSGSGAAFKAGSVGRPRGEEPPLGHPLPATMSTDGEERRDPAGRGGLQDFAGSMLVDEHVAEELQAKCLHFLRRGRIITDDELALTRSSTPRRRAKRAAVAVMRPRGGPGAARDQVGDSAGQPHGVDRLVGAARKGSRHAGGASVMQHRSSAAQQLSSTAAQQYSNLYICACPQSRPRMSAGYHPLVG